MAALFTIVYFFPCQLFFEVVRLFGSDEDHPMIGHFG